LLFDMASWLKRVAKTPTIVAVQSIRRGPTHESSMTKFLVVDDEPADLALLKGLLEKQDHQVLTATTAA